MNGYLERSGFIISLLLSSVCMVLYTCTSLALIVRTMLNDNTELLSLLCFESTLQGLDCFKCLFYYRLKHGILYLVIQYTMLEIKYIMLEIPCFKELRHTFML